MDGDHQDISAIEVQIQDSPEFWLGQISAIVAAGVAKHMTKTQAFNAIRRILHAAGSHEMGKHQRALRIARALSEKAGPK